MNFTAFRNSKRNSEQSAENPITSNLNNSEVEDITSSIVDSLENGTFYERHATKPGLPGYFRTDIKSELDDILSWLNSVLIPQIKHEATQCSDKRTLYEYIDNVKVIKDKFSELGKFLNDCVSNNKKKQSEGQNSFTCITCKEVIVLPTRSNLWIELMKHEHIERNLANTLKGCSISDIMMPQGGVISCATQNVKERNSSSDVQEGKLHEARKANLSKQVLDAVTKYATKEETKINQCCLVANYLSNFKFNFDIRYDPKIEEQLYCPRFIERDVRDIDGLGRPTFQFRLKTPPKFTCLICLCEIAFTASSKLFIEHMRGHRHQKRKETPQVLDAFYMYHECFLQEEPKYQAHQIHFIPKNEHEAICVLCDRITISYDFLEDHINSKMHKERFYQVYKINKIRLLDLQAEVYDEGDNGGGSSNNNNNNSITSSFDDETDSLVEEESDDDDVLLDTSIVIEKSDGKIKSEHLEINKNVAGTSDKHLAANRALYTKINNRERQVSNEMAEAEANNSESAEERSKNKYKNHTIVKSVLNEKGRKLEDLLENRLLPHLKVLTKFDEKQIECKSCNLRIPNDILFVKDHILSKAHQTKTKLINVIYQFHCEICNIVLKESYAWKDHMKRGKHIEKCNKLGASRKTNLTEYECKTCKLVIFGDELSVKRHIGSYSKSAWLRQKKEIALPSEVKSLMGSERNIMERCYQLVREANSVLLNQEPVNRCCRALESALHNVYPKCRAYPFGSRVSGLGNEKSDLDIFVDVDDMYLGNKNQDPRSQEKFVITSCKEFRKKKDEFSHVNPIPTARTPIVQVYHLSSKLDCDLSFRHGLSVENTKFLKLCIDIQPITQPMILLLKQWLEYSKLNENITTYALSMMVIFHLQVMGYLMPVHELKQYSANKIYVIDGWGVVDFTNLTPAVRERVKQFHGKPIELLKKFFSYYSSFNYATDVVCPLLGRPIRRSLFLVRPNGEDLPLEMLAYVQKLIANPESEYFRARSPFCVQDPFDLSHNLVKACTFKAVDKLKSLCDLTFKHLTNLS